MFCDVEALSVRVKTALLFPGTCLFVVNTMSMIRGWLAGTSGRFLLKVPVSALSSCVILALIVIASSLLPAEAAPGMVIKEISVEGLSSLSREELLDLLDMKIGEVLDPLKIRTGIKRAFLKGIFEDIEVYAEEKKDGVRIVVKERDRIRDVNVAGNEYFSSRRIRAMFPLKEGQLLRHDRLDNAVSQLREALIERGFPHARASVEISPASGMYTKDLTITLNEGPPLLIERIVIRGAPDEEIEEIRDLIPMKEGDIYDTSALPKAVERIRNHYKGLGYLNPTVSHLFADGTMDITVTLGRKLTVRFEGNTVFGSGRLAKEIPFSDAGEVRDDVIEDAARKITSLYYGKGYASCQVAPVISEAPGNATEITFFIFEGERVTVGALMFPGMTLPEKNLKEVLPLKEGDDYNPNLVSSDADVVREFYVALGYLGVEVESPGVRIEQNKALITMSVKEGQKTVISEVEVTGYRSVAPEEILKAIGLKPGDAYNEVDMADARLRVIELCQDKGFLDVFVSPKVEIAEEKARITFEIQEGERTFFGKTIITGNTGTKREVIARELLHRESAPFNYGVIAKERQRLYKLGLFANVRVEPLDLYDHRRDIHIEVVEGDAGTVEFGVGYNNFDKFTGFVDIGYANLFGMNRQLSLRVGYNSLERLYAINYVDPWFLDQPLQLKGTVFLNERDEKNIDTKVVMYRYRKQGISLGVEKRYSSTTKGEIYYEYVFADTSDVQPDIVLTAKDVGSLGISSIRPGITYDTRDNPFDPRNGVLAGVTMKVASSAFLSETSFAKAVVNGSLYHEVARPFVLAVAFRFGIAHAWGSSEILPLIERFFLGGRSTVRGYAQDTLGPRGSAGNPTGGNAFIETNLELRTSLGKGIGLVTFLDSGNVWQRIGDIDGSLKHAVGVGLRYNTPVGPVRVDYGYKLKKEEGLSRGELFFSIGQAF